MKTHLYDRIMYDSFELTLNYFLKMEDIFISIGAS